MARTAAKTKQQELDELLDAFAKKYGDGFIHTADQSVPVNRIPFLEPSINAATEGGAPWGRWMALYGQTNSGKSRIAFELIAQAQQLPVSAERVLIPRIAYHSALQDETALDDAHRRRHMELAGRLSDELDWVRREFPHGADAIYYNAEAQFDKLWAKKIGIDPKRLRIVESMTIEEIMDVAGSLYPHVPIHIIDSTSSTSSLISQSKDVGKNPGYGDSARMWKQTLTNAMSSWDREHNMGIMIHQMSTDPRTSASRAVATNYMTFISRLSLRFSYGRFLYRKDGVLRDAKGASIEEGRPPPADGREVFVKCEKSTVCRPFREAGLQWDYGKSMFVTINDLALAAINHGVVTASGSWYKVVGEEKPLGQGLRSVYARLADDEEMRAHLTCKLLDHTAEV